MQLNIGNENQYCFNKSSLVQVRLYITCAIFIDGILINVSAP